MSNADALLADYASHHQTKGNVACHFVGIPLIVFGIVCMLLRVPVFAPVTGAEVLIALSFLYYLTLDAKLAISMLLVSAAFDLVGRQLGASSLVVGIVAFVVGWIFQGIGHAVYEKKAPSFLTNLVHLMVGPIFLVNETIHVRKIALAEKHG